MRNALRVVHGPDRDLYIGGDLNGRLLEVVVLDDEHEMPLAIHVMPLRRKCYDQL